MRIRIVSILLVLTGCATDLGPVDQPEFENVLRASLSVGEQELLLVGRAVWYPETNGRSRTFMNNPG